MNFSYLIYFLPTEAEESQYFSVRFFCKFNNQPKKIREIRKCYG